jgi:hypothetical protein
LEKSKDSPNIGHVIWLIEGILFVADNFSNELPMTFQLLIRTALLVHTSVVFPYGISDLLKNDFVPISKCRGYLIALMGFIVWAIPVATVSIWPDVAPLLILVGIEQTSEQYSRIIILLIIGIGIAFVLFYRVARSFITENLGVDKEHSEIIMDYVIWRSALPAVIFSLVVMTCISATQLDLSGFQSEMNYGVYARDLSIVLVLYVILYVWYVPERISGWRTRATNYLPPVAVILSILSPQIGIGLLVISGVGLFIMTRMSPKITLGEMVESIKSKEERKRQTPAALMYNENPIVVILGMSFVLGGIMLSQFLFLIGWLDVFSNVIISTIIVAFFFALEKAALSFHQSRSKRSFSSDVAS